MRVIEFLNRFMENDRLPDCALDSLRETYGIKSRIYPLTGLVVLNYCQIESSRYKTEKIVRECRSLVLTYPEIHNTYPDGEDEPCFPVSDKFKVVSRSFDRFFNLNEVRLPHKIDKLLAVEKLDGILV